MRLNRALAQYKFAGNLAVRLALCNQRGDFTLASGQVVRLFLGRWRNL